MLRAPDLIYSKCLSYPPATWRFKQSLKAKDTMPFDAVKDSEQNYGLI